MKLRISLLCVFVCLCFANSGAFRINHKQKLTNGCVKCHDTDPNKINVHLVHHSHDDVGWLKTYDEYYWGLNSSYAQVGVQYIITSVVNALWDHPDRRFIQVETAFFWKWWKNQDEVMRNKFITLVDNGQLEIINGGWVMNDEACVNYQSTIDQFTWGFRVLNDALGDCGNPTIGWQIDPFGHTREHASILSKIGFDALFFARLDENDREQRKKDGDMDFLWKSSANNEESVIFSGMFAPDHLYYPPSGFCFDVFGCSDDSIIDNPDDDEYNVISKASEFADLIKSYISYFKTKNVLITMGGDFQYQAAEINFINSDRLIKAFENHPDINLIYSTPSCYVKAVYESQPNLTLKTDDFFPYGSNDHSYWAGYFTSKQNFKRFERIGHNTLQVAKQLNALVGAANASDINVDSIKRLREATGTVQHHDAITGTEKRHVAKDYAKILSRAVTQAEEPFTNLIGKLVNIDLTAYTNLSSCLLANISVCTTSQDSDEFIVVAYNPLAWPVSHAVRLPVEGESFTVRESEGPVSSDVLTPLSNFSYVEPYDYRPAKRELVFIASDIPPLGIKVYYVSKAPANTVKQHLENTFKFGDEDIGFEIDSTTNLLKSVTMNGETVQITQQFLHYTSHNGTNETDASGAYIFRPTGEAIPFDNPTILSRSQGSIVDEVQQRINNWITQIIRVYKGPQNYIEFDWLVGPLEIQNKLGIEIISRFTVQNFKNDQTFYTDSNGREMIERKLFYRPTYTYNASFEPIASNYYPVTAKIVIRDEEQKLQVAVLTDRSQGGSSLGEGEIELMVHRLTMKDDSKGVDEALNETEFGQGIVARGQHYLILGPSSKSLDDGKTLTAQERILAQQKLLQPWIGVGDASKFSEQLIGQLLNANYSALKKSLPENINILTFEPWVDSTYLLRLEHILEKDEDPSLSDSVTVDLSALFSGFTVQNIVETTLGANRILEDSLNTKLDWTYMGKNFRDSYQFMTASEVVLAPMDIKTFLVELVR